MERWTIEKLNGMSDLRFARAILSERLNRLTQPYSPLATKIRSAIDKLEELAIEEESNTEPVFQPKHYANYKEVFDDLGWTCLEWGDGTMELAKHSPAGEDFSFTVDDDDIPQEVADYAESFDSDEHAAFFVEIRGTHGVPGSIRELIDDAEAIQKMLNELAVALEPLTNCRMEVFDWPACAIHGTCGQEEKGGNCNA